MVKNMLNDDSQSWRCCGFERIKSFLPGMTFNHQTTIQPVMVPYMNYRMVLSPQTDRHAMMQKLQILAQEDPTLHISYMPETQDIYIQLMGEIQIEILQNMIRERFHEDVHFDHGEIFIQRNDCQAN